MLNPIFWIVFLFDCWLIAVSFRKWESSLLIFFIYLQLGGLLKRVAYALGGFDGMAYNLFVGLQYVVVFFICFNALKTTQHKLPPIIIRSALLFIVILILSLSAARVSLGHALMIAVLNFFPASTLVLGYLLPDEYRTKWVTLLIRTAPLHAVYQIHQFLFGPFEFELTAILEKSSLSQSIEGDFIRGIPLYENIELLYLHFLTAFVAMVDNKKWWNTVVYGGVIMTAVLMMGNRSAIILILLGWLFYKILGLGFKAKALCVYLSVFTCVTMLNVAGNYLMTAIEQVEQLEIGETDFAARLGTLRTYFDRIRGRDIAFKNISIFGLGFGASGLSTVVLDNKGVGGVDIDRDLFAHDLIGEIVLDFGVVGLIAMILFFHKIIGFGMVRHNSAIFLAVALSSFSTSALIGSSLTFGRAGYFVFMCIGIILANYYFIGEKNQHVKSLH